MEILHSIPASAGTQGSLRPGKGIEDGLKGGGGRVRVDSIGACVLGEREEGAGGQRRSEDSEPAPYFLYTSLQLLQLFLLTNYNLH